MEDMSRHIVISLILLLALIFFLLLSNRIYTNRQTWLRNRQLRERSPRPSSPHSTDNTAPASTTQPLWRHFAGTLTQSPSGNGLHFTPSPQGQGDVVVNIPIGVQFWNGRDVPTRTHTSQNADTHRGWEDDTPSVWGIDLGRRGFRGGLRSGATVLVPPPGAIVIASTANVPSMMGARRGRRGIQDDVGMEEGEGLPRYEEPPPGYEKVLAEGVTGVGTTPGEAAEGSHGSGVAAVSENTHHAAVGVQREMDSVRDFPTPPEPAVTRDRPTT